MWEEGQFGPSPPWALCCKNSVVLGDAPSCRRPMRGMALTVPGIPRYLRYEVGQQLVSNVFTTEYAEIEAAHAGEVRVALSAAAEWLSSRALV